MKALEAILNFIYNVLWFASVALFILGCAAFDMYLSSKDDGIVERARKRYNK